MPINPYKVNIARVAFLSILYIKIKEGKYTYLIRVLINSSLEINTINYKLTEAYNLLLKKTELVYIGVADYYISFVGEIKKRI